MYNNSWRTRAATMVKVVCLLGLCLWSAPAAASVSVFVQIYPEPDSTSGDVVMLTGYHVANTDAPEFQVCVEGWIEDPNNQVVAASNIECEYGGSVAVNTTAYVDPASVVDGEYRAKAYGSDAGSSDSDGGCALSKVGISTIITTYQLVRNNGDGTALYVRCVYGPCNYAPVKGLGVTVPVYILAFVLRVSYGFGEVCFGSSPFPVGGCPPV